jgi:hypothetical protein
MVANRQTMAEANYGRGNPIEHCGICRYYRGAHRCALVMGDVSPFGLSDLFRAEPSPFPKTMTPQEMNLVRVMAADAADRSGGASNAVPPA